MMPIRKLSLSPSASNNTMEILMEQIVDRLKVLEAIGKQFHEHDKQITYMSATVETMNKIIATQNDTMLELRTDLQQHWNAQDKLMAQNEAILKQLADGNDRFKTIDKRQTETGCPFLIAHLKEREVVMQKIKEDKERIEYATRKNREELDEIYDLVKQNAESTKQLLESVADLKTRVSTIEKEPLDTWKRIKADGIKIFVSVIITGALAYYGFKK